MSPREAARMAARLPRQQCITVLGRTMDPVWWRRVGTPPPVPRGSLPRPEHDVRMFPLDGDPTASTHCIAREASVLYPPASRADTSRLESTHGVGGVECGDTSRATPLAPRRPIIES